MFYIRTWYDILHYYDIRLSSNGTVFLGNLILKLFNILMTYLEDLVLAVHKFVYLLHYLFLLSVLHRLLIHELLDQKLFHVRANASRHSTLAGCTAMRVGYIEIGFIPLHRLWLGNIICRPRVPAALQGVWGRNDVETWCQRFNTILDWKNISCRVHCFILF